MSQSRKASRSSRPPNTPRSIAPAPIAVPTGSNLSMPRQEQPFSNLDYGAPSMNLAGSSSSDRLPSNSMIPPSKTASTQSYGLSVSSSSPNPSTSSLLMRPPSTLGNTIPSPSPTTIYALPPYTPYPEFLAPSPSPIPSSFQTQALSPTREDYQAYAHFCRQILETFRNMARGLLGARPGLYQIQQNHDTIAVPIPTRQEHRRLAAQTSAAVSELCQYLPLPPTPPYHDRRSQEDIALTSQTLWIISYPHHLTAAGEMRSGLTDYFRNADRNLKILCRNVEWGFLARRCRRKFALFIEELPWFEFETMFDEGEGEYFVPQRVGV
ncbi:hypothetical protein E6O75_ATG03086 [Venturia nashicola]|uniref:Uncharacterized protein n=1 Tax=Venturia nashicola TaxID=86259 RepID=A0A4Z1PJ90_9PEZI|nr:hypothetical protein E6O75_ATG03086 [Venturia nashicola]